MWRNDALHLRINALFTEPGRPPLLEPEAEAEPRIVFAPREILRRSNISISPKSDTAASIRQFPFLFPSPASQNSSLGFRETPKFNISGFLHRHLRGKFCSKAGGGT
jgi:hypothetical protein